GLSAGGAMAVCLLAAYPELFAGGAVIAGVAYGAASSVGRALDRMAGRGFPPAEALQTRARAASGHDGPWPRLSVWQGAADRTVHPVNAEMIVAQWRGLHGLPEAPAAVEAVPGGVRRVWRAADGGEMLEDYAVADMGHGLPLDLQEPRALGAKGPFMLDV